MLTGPPGSPEFDPGELDPPPPGTRELAERVAPMIYGQRPPAWWKAPAILVAIGLLLLAIGLLWMRRSGQAALEQDLRRCGPDGLFPGAGALELGPRDAPTAALLLHGWATCPADFGALPGQLADCGLYVSAPLLPGHGRDPREFARLELGELEAAVSARYQELLIDHPRVILIGFSMGASLATRLTASLPAEQAPVGLCLIAPFFSIRTPGWALFDATTWARWMAPVLPYLAAGPEFVRLAQRENSDQVIKFEALPLSAVSLLANLEAGMTQDLLERVHCPVLMVVSTGDHAADSAASERAFGLLGSTDKQLLKVSRSDHQLFHDYDSQILLDALQRFSCPR